MMKTFRYFLLVLFLICGLVVWDWCNLFSQTFCQKDFKDFSEVSLEELLDVTVTSASKHEQEISRAPAFVTVITDEMIEAFNYHSVADALRSVPGMWITSDRYLFQLGIRGVAVDGDWNSRILLLLNGHALNEQWCGTANLDELMGIDMSNVKRIEVVKSPGSSLYGSNSFFGVINVVTKDAESAGGPRLVTRFTDQVDRTDGNFSFGRKFSDDFKVLFSGSVSNSRGGRLFFPEYRDLEESERLALEENGYSKYFLSLDKLTGGYTSRTDFLKSYSLFLDLHFRDWSLLSKVSDRNKGVPSGYYGSVFNTDKNRIEERFNFLELKYSKSFYEKHKFMGRLYYDDYYYADWILYDYFSDPELGYENPPYLPGPIWMDKGTDKFWGTELQFDLHVTASQRLIWGGEFQDHKVEQHSGETDKSEKRIENDVVPQKYRSSDEGIFNLYAQNEYHPIKELNLVLGLHYNKSTLNQGRVTPKLGLILSPEEKTIFKLLYSQGFRAPAIYERTFDDATYFIGNDKLVPEEVKSYEFVFEKYMPWARIVTSFYLNEARKIITQEPVDSADPSYPGGTYEEVVFQYQNVEKLEAKGVEFSIERSLNERWGGFFNFSYCQTEDKQTGHRLLNSPEILSNLGFNYHWIKNKFSTALEFHYVDSRKAYDETIIGSYLCTNLSFTLRRVARFVDLSLTIRNLFDVDMYDPVFKDYLPVVLMKQDGRTLGIRASLSLY
jgi:outer membrane receptor for ferrienterochelin and colicins